MCNCEYCIKCERCGHKADEHMAGDGQCFICNCEGFTHKIANIWDNMNLHERIKYDSFEDFMNKMETEQ